jgi:hypothetical protein
MEKKKAAEPVRGLENRCQWGDLVFCVLGPRMPAQMMKTFLKRMLTVLFFCVSPDSRHAKPRGMMKTRNAQRRIQRLLIAKKGAFS